MKVILKNSSLNFQQLDSSYSSNLLDNLAYEDNKMYHVDNGKFVGGDGVRAYTDKIPVTQGETIYVGHLRTQATGIRTSAWDGQGNGWTLLNPQGWPATSDGAFVVPATGDLCVSGTITRAPFLVTRSEATYNAWIAEHPTT
jgi:hypothetical protein